MSKIITTNEKQPVVIAKSGKESKHISSNKVESEYFAKTPDVIAGGTGPIIDTANVDRILNREKRKKLILYDYLRFVFHHNNEIDIRKVFPGFKPIKNVRFLMDREKENSIAENKKKQIKIIIERKKR